MNYEKMTVKELRAMAKELGVLPSGRVKKQDLIDALQPGGPSEPEGPSEQWRTSQEVYQFDRMYRVEKPFNGYEVGDLVSNFNRTLGLARVADGSIKLVEGAPRASNPRAVARVVPQT